MPSLTWPVEVINELRKNPTNSEAWGELAGGFLMGKLTSQKPGLVGHIISRARERISLATKFFSKEGIPINQTSGIDFSLPVQKVKLEAGTELIQWRMPGQSPNGSWFTVPGVDPGHLRVTFRIFNRAQN